MHLSDALLFIKKGFAFGKTLFYERDFFLD